MAKKQIKVTLVKSVFGQLKQHRATVRGLGLRRIRDTVLARPDAPKVELAFLEFMTPTLPEAIAALARDGVRKVAVVPVFLAQGGHLKRDLPVLLDEARGAHPGCEITLATAAGEAEPVVRAMADYATSCLG